MTTTMTHRDSIVDLLHRAIDSINAQLPTAKKMAKSPDFPLIGPHSSVESLTLMSFIVDAEERIHDELGIELVLSDHIGLPLEENPFRTLDSLASDIAMRLDPR